jgi:hypothetical protein
MEFNSSSRIDSRFTSPPVIKLMDEETDDTVLNAKTGLGMPPVFKLMNEDAVLKKAKKGPGMPEIFYQTEGTNVTHGDMLRHERHLFDTQCPSEFFESIARFNREMDAKPKSDQRISVVFSDGNGLGDRLTMAISTFFTSALSNRGFKILWQSEEKETVNVTIFDAYDSPFDIDLKYQGELPDDTKYIKFNWFSDKETYPREYYATKDIGKEYANTQVIKWKGNRGSVHLMMENPHHRQWFFDKRLYSENAFGCAFNFLFQPTVDTFRGMERYFDLFRRTDTLKIGMHIRTGDSSIGNDTQANAELLKQSVEQFMHCAEQIEGVRQDEEKSKQIVWFVASDSYQVVSELKAQRPDRVVAVENTVIEHSKGAHVEGMRSAVREHFLLGMMDYVIMYRRTSFGRTGALRSLKWNSIYEIRKGSQKSPRCGPHDYEKWNDYTTGWVGI